MSLLPQVKRELVSAGRRPVRANRVRVRVLVVLLAAVAALLISAPPTVARLPASIMLAAAHTPR